MLDGIKNSGQPKKLQTFQLSDGQEKNGKQALAQNTKEIDIGGLLGGVKLPSKQQLDNLMKKVAFSQDEAAFLQKLNKETEEKVEKFLKEDTRVLPFVPDSSSNEKYLK